MDEDPEYEVRPARVVTCLIAGVPIGLTTEDSPALLIALAALAAVTVVVVIVSSGPWWKPHLQLVYLVACAFAAGVVRQLVYGQ